MLDRSKGLNVGPAVALIATAVFLLSPLLSKVLPAGLVSYPDGAVLPISTWIGDGLNWLAHDAVIGSLKISAITRWMASVAETPMLALDTILNKGWMTGYGENVHRAVPPLSWLTISGTVAICAMRLGGYRLAALSVIGLIYLLTFGLWNDSMATLSGVFMATLVAVIVGVMVGTFVYHRPGTATAVTGIMNVMQTVPVFSYLVPTLLFLGYGPSASLVATAIYALPPMVHATFLGLQAVPGETLEYAKMSGATKRQAYWRIQIPSSISFLGVGLNQAIMASLNMVIVASMIGSGGLGYLVLVALRRLDIGSALQAGMAIVVLAVILDRFSQALARLLIGEGTQGKTFNLPVTLVAWVGFSIAFSLAIPFIQDWPEGWTLTTAHFWNDMISWINQNLYGPLNAVRNGVLLNVMLPFRNYLLSMPWFVLILGFVGAGYWLGGQKTALFGGILMLLIAVTGFWTAAVTSIYLVLIGAIISLMIGLPIGYAASISPVARRAADLILDTLQTLPTLVYIIPAVMIFRNGDFSAVLAITSYAVAPAVRYALLGFSDVPAGRIEAAAMCGATRWQGFRWVRLPHALPSLVLGVNQTLMMAIAMLVITALVGTRDLGQQVYMALSRMHVGEGIVGGLAVAAIALTFDSLLKAVVAKYWPPRESGKQGGH